jgi:hypothetical protein
MNEQFYLTESNALSRCSSLTGLAEDEIISLVGIFSKRSRWSGLPRGKIVVKICGEVQIRKSFGNKLLWSNK